MYFNGNKLYMFPSCAQSQCMGFLLSGGGCVIGIDSCTGGEADLIESEIMSLGGKVDCWFLTHAHFDHIDGLRELLERGRIKVEKIYCNFPEIPEIERIETADGGRSVKSAVKLSELIKERGINVIKPEKGKNIRVGHFNVLPLTDGSGHYETLNPTSIVYRVDTNGKSILFLGDTEESHEDKILKEFPDKISCPIVQTAHHGQHGVSERFYNAVTPEAALWCTPDWLWNNDIGNGFNTGPFATIETRLWLEKLNVVNLRPTNETLIIE